ncbi:hypothetical protein [Croceicoccus marinus]|uniref:Uncharacterized protein n=1 Tax=Croceicoccus marinus TaxID=450378 RepID=A0A1Z1FAI4_9SPHN|nr:hypothetical protein [Croceicoccus marinus]ARU15780.1 hypothetical protein A9D14_05775 [Croceicoccus marinus]
MGTGFVPYPSAVTHSASTAAVHSYLVSLRALLKISVQVIEIIPPQVATDLMVDLKEPPQSVPLDKFADDVMAPLTVQPDADEIIVEEVEPFRFPERDGTLREIVASMTDSD